MMKKIVYLAFVFFLLSPVANAITAEFEVELDSGGHLRKDCPFVVTLPKSLAADNQYELLDEQGNSIPLQATRGRQLVGIVDELAAGQVARYRLRTAKETPSRVTADQSDSRLTIKLDGSAVCCFNFGKIEAPEGIDPLYRRSGYLHPVFTPSGQVVTGDFEPDHPHQHGVFMAWVNASHDGKPVDFWNQAKQTGGVRFRRFVRKFRSGPVFGEFTAELDYFVVSDSAQATSRQSASGQSVIKDRWHVRVYATNRDSHLIELQLRQAATAGPVSVNEYHYGGFAMRGPGEWLSPKDVGNAPSTNSADRPAAGDFVTSAGRTRADGNHTRARWVEMHGPRGSQHAGLIALAATTNFRGPQTVRLHGSKPYFCFAPMVDGEFRIDRQPFRSQFRLAPHDGGPDPQLAERLWQDLAHPIRTRVVSK